MSASEELPEPSATPPDRRFVLSRWSAAAIVTLAFASVSAGASALFTYVEHQGGWNDDRDIQVSLFFAVVMGLLWLGAIISIFRSTGSHQR
jgi:hypothetical protein